MMQGSGEVSDQHGDHLIDMPELSDGPLDAGLIGPASAAGHAFRNERYRALFDNNFDAVFLLDRSGHFTEANPAAERLSGYSQPELHGTSFMEICVPEDRHKAMFFFARGLGGAPRAVELSALCKDGNVADLYVSGAPIFSGNSVVGLFCIARDITHKRRAEDQLRKARKDAEQARDRFLAVVSHELRTPLMPVLTTIQLLEQRNELPLDIQDALSMMRRNLELEARLIDDLLDLSRVRQGKLSLHLQNVDLHTKLHNVVNLCSEESSAKRLHVHMDLAAEDHRLAADPSRLHQIIWNILGNAVKYTPEGGSIWISTCNGGRPVAECGGAIHGRKTCRKCGHFRKGRFIAVHIRDSGIGIPSEAVDRLFEAFGNDENHHRGGRGVGLAITRALVELHGGQLAVHSDGHGKGSTFTVILPLRNVSLLPMERSAPPRKTETDVTRNRVLLVEDHADTARALCRLLADAGLTVTVATNVKSAIDIVNTHTFDLLVSDIGLPDGTGLDVVRHLHQRQQVPAIALSGYGMEEDLRRSREAGFSEHLVKPINITQLRQTIRRLLAAS